MQILVSNHGSYPVQQGNPPSTKHGAAATAIESAIREQESLGVDLVTDGQVTWTNPCSHLFAFIDGVRFAGTTSFPGTDITYAEPVIEARIRYRRPLTLQDLRTARTVARADVKAVLTGPYTLARLSRVTTTAYPTMSALATDISIALAQEVRELTVAGARFIQIDEPMILRQPEHIRLLRELLDTVQTPAGSSTHFAVATYWGDSAALYAQLNSLPGDVLSLDLCSDRELADTIATTGCGKTLALGIVDGRSSQLEDADSLARLVERILHRYAHETIYLQPSCGLGSLPHNIARAKLELLSSARKRLLGVPAET